MEELPNYARDERPWGYFERYTANESSTVKYISVSPNQALSLQSHGERDEFWRIVSGSGTVSLEGDDQPAKAGDRFFIPRRSKHRVSAGPDGLSFLEIALGEFREDDITRFEDRYGRVVPH